MYNQRMKRVLAAALIVMLPAASASAHHLFAAEYNVEAIGASHGG